jgi:RNA polymerase sigma-70 factor (ECF subfamily)
MDGFGWLPLRSGARPAPKDDSSADGEALLDAYDKYATAIYQFAYRRLGNREDAQDVTSQVFMKASRSLDASYDEAARRAWLFRAAKTAVVDVWRSFGGCPVVPLEWYTEDKPPARQTASDAAERVAKVLARLNPTQRRVLEMRFLESRSLQETAIELGLTEGNVKVIQHRALRRAAELNMGDLDG